MTIDLIQQRLENYHCAHLLEQEHAIKEITQEIALMALAQTNFFQLAEFQGGTALRIVYGLPRFSEDLDFVLRTKDPTFTWQPYLEKIQQVLDTFNYALQVTNRSKADSAVKKAFIKDNSIGKLLNLKYQFVGHPEKKIRIKFEIDTHPPDGSLSEIKYHDFPLPFEIRCQTLPTTFAGKIHALLCRPYVKGRDWYDFNWYIMRKTNINWDYLTHALYQWGPWKEQTITVNSSWLHKALSDRIHQIDWEMAKKDVTRFLREREQTALRLWSGDFFMSRLEQLP